MVCYAYGSLPPSRAVAPLHTLRASASELLLCTGPSEKTRKEEASWPVTLILCVKHRGCVRL